MLRKYENLRLQMALAIISVLVFGLFVVGNVAAFGTGVPTKTLDEAASPAETIVVDTTSEVDQNNCTSAPNDCSLRGAIFHANVTLADDTITFAIPSSDSGCFGGVCTINLPLGEMYVDRTSVAGRLTIDGSGANEIRISGGDLYRIFFVETAANLTLNNLTLANGKAHPGSPSNAGLGGCVYNRGRVNLVRSTVANCMATNSGGGIFNNGVLTVTDSTIRDNSADARTNGVGGANGGGIYNRAYLEINRSTITANRVIVNASNFYAIGGGILSSGGAGFTTTLHIINSTISGNVASGLATNSLARGAGISNVGGGTNNTMNIVNSTITANSASIAANVVGDAAGGGIFAADMSAPSIKNTIIAGNSVTANSAVSPDALGIFSSGGYNLIGKSDGANGFTTTGDQAGSISSPLDARLAPLANNGGPAVTHALCTSAGIPHASCTGASPAIDKGASADDPVFALLITIDQRGMARPFDNQAIPSATQGNHSDIGAFEVRPRNPIFDFDGDTKTDLSIFRSSNGQWWYQRSSDGVVPAFTFGVATDTLTPGDFTGDGKTDVAFFRPSNGHWYVLRSEDSAFYAFPFGAAGDVPVPADYDGDGKTDAAVFRPSTTTWFILRSSDSGYTITNFGAGTDKPVVADYDGDGKGDIGIFRPADGTWWHVRSSDSQLRVYGFGNASDRPTPGDFTGDGKADVAFWRPSNGHWYVLRSEDTNFYAFPFGSTGDVPTPGDYDGDGRIDAAVFRPTTATWFVNRSTQGTFIQNFGLTTDTPIPSAFVP